ncbi:MAG: carboxypeptidase-like regulatory domain-containing protein [Cyclobacteriaceae bacterium]
MYQVENHILECDFCGEALDGLESRTPTEMQIAFEKIQHSLDSRKPKQKWSPDINLPRSPLLGLGLICLVLGAVWLLTRSNNDQAKLTLGQQFEGQTSTIDEETKAAITEAFTLDTRSVRKQQEPTPEPQSAIAQAVTEETMPLDDQGGSGDSRRISRGKNGGENSGIEEVATPEVLDQKTNADTDIEPAEIEPDFNQVAVGQVLDAKTKAPLANVSFKVDGDGNQVTSNDQGYYNLSLTGSQAIVSIHYNGLVMDKLSVDNENQLKVYLDLERKEISNIIYITNANRFK